MDRGDEWTEVVCICVDPPPTLVAYIINQRPLVLFNEPDNT